jgi:hypothetical protein
MEICNNLSQTTTKYTTNLAHDALFINYMHISTTTMVIIIIMTDVIMVVHLLELCSFLLFRNYVKVLSLYHEQKDGRK